MKLKSEAHKALSLLFQQDMKPPAIICDNAKEVILGKFIRKLKEALQDMYIQLGFSPKAAKLLIREQGLPYIMDYEALWFSIHVELPDL